MSKNQKYNSATAIKKSRKYYQKNKERLRKEAVVKRYGISVEQYEQMFIEQNFQCALCSIHNSESPLYVDHCHDTNEVRGLLCNKCNSLLGGFQYHYNNLNNVLAYLDQERI